MRGQVDGEVGKVVAVALSTILRLRVVGKHWLGHKLAVDVDQASLSVVPDKRARRVTVSASWDTYWAQYT